ncbi:5'/3'-nucleotidase SurE [Thalassolituus sp. LLYu03]|uniref:5'/3'-nucleotidase SurE n=1 Tax=Thalassolituus sp. LLYu03 TaxID=3421656 RepID=UPI003D2A1256
MKRTPLAGLMLASALLAQPASALNIVLTNDDSWSTDNINVLFTKLKAAGHDVIMSAPCTGQSGKGGAVSFLKAVTVDRTEIADQKACVGDTDTSKAFSSYVEGTPVMASLYGIDVLAPEIWGSAPDLLISGPNEGNNLGYLTNSSGTLGAANIALARGIPAIAVSAETDDADTAALVADAVVELVATLEASRPAGQPLLPAFTGLNVNTPEDMENHKGFHFSQVGWNGGMDVYFSSDLSQDSTAMGYVAQGILSAGYAASFEAAYAMAQASYAGKVGVSIGMDATLVNDTAADSEANLLAEGYITISPMEASVQASQVKNALVKQRLSALSE